MEKYKNISGKSAISEYKIGLDFIEVKFFDGEVYLFNYKSTGVSNVEQMKQCAESGSGLCTFINTKIKNKYKTS